MTDEVVRVCAVRDEWEWFKEMQAEGRTRDLRVTSFREWADDREVYLEIREVRDE